MISEDKWDSIEKDINGVLQIGWNFNRFPYIVQLKLKIWRSFKNTHLYCLSFSSCSFEAVWSQDLDLCIKVMCHVGLGCTQGWPKFETMTLGCRVCQVHMLHTFKGLQGRTKYSASLRETCDALLRSIANGLQKVLSALGKGSLLSGRWD